MLLFSAGGFVVGGACSDGTGVEDAADETSGATGQSTAATSSSTSSSSSSTSETQAESSSSVGTTGSDGSTSGTGSSSSSGAADTRCDALRASLERVAATYARSESLVGLVVSVANDGCAPWSQSWGVANIAADEPSTTDHLHRAGSLTKSYTAALLLKLAEDDLLTLDDTLAQWGIDLPSAAEITLRQLLNHTSGLSDYQSNPAFTAAIVADPTREWTPNELIDLAVDLGPVGVPGAAHAYSNTNYVLAAIVAESASGDAFADALRERVLEPNGLMHTYLEGSEAWKETTATGYVVVGDNPPEDSSGFYSPSQVWSAGAVACTVDDLREWVFLLFASDFLAAASQIALVDLVPSPGTNGYGLGIFSVEAGGGSAFGHNGAVQGFQAAALYSPAAGTSVAVMHNQITLSSSGLISSTPTTLAIQLLDAAALR